VAAQRSGDKKVRTVLGDIDPQELGRTDVHEHLLMRSPLLRVASQGGADLLLLGGDVARRATFRSYGGLPGMAYLPRRFVPRLAEMGKEDLVRRILVDNPARFLSFTPPEDG
jgi:predicted metal-dependent phosphotriesterase family hydrolase